MWRQDDPQGHESAKCKYDIVEYTRGRGLDIGSGPMRTFPHFIPVDNCHHAIQFGWQMDPGTVQADASDLGIFADDSMDFVFSSHLLEHISDTRKALTEWWRVVKPGGHLVLYLPHKDLYPRCGTPGANPDHKHDFGPNDISRRMAEIGNNWDLRLNQVRDHDNGPGEWGNEYSFLQVYQKVAGAKRPAFSYKEPDLHPSVAVIRYGGIGDMVQTGAVLPGLKEQGYHVTVVTTPMGEEVLKHDPHVDAFFIQDKDQVPNAELPAFWDVLEKRFDKVINLCESVEGTMLVMHDRAAARWPIGIRRQLCNRNYIEWMQDIAEVPRNASHALWRASDTEMEWAHKRKREMLEEGNATRLIMWCLTGSSRHKVNPYMDIVAARVMTSMPNTSVCFVGGQDNRELQGGWQLEERVKPLAGELGVRETMALAKVCDLVIGPETGVINSVAMEPVAKLLMLSHSSVENLPRDWVNTTVLVPDVPCHPCHKMHYGRSDCPFMPIPSKWQVPEGGKMVPLQGDVPVCVGYMDPDRIWDAMVQIMEKQEAA